MSSLVHSQLFQCATGSGLGTRLVEVYLWPTLGSVESLNPYAPPCWEPAFRKLPIANTYWSTSTKPLQSFNSLVAFHASSNDCIQHQWNRIWIRLMKDIQVGNPQSLLEIPWWWTKDRAFLKALEHHIAVKKVDNLFTANVVYVPSSGMCLHFGVCFYPLYSSYTSPFLHQLVGICQIVYTCTRKYQHVYLNDRSSYMYMYVHLLSATMWSTASLESSERQLRHSPRESVVSFSREKGKEGRNISMFLALVWSSKVFSSTFFARAE